jgi:hypothetical protein
MKPIGIFIVCSIFIAGCATSYQPISKLESVGDAAVKNDDLEMTVGIQQMGKNSRFQDKLEEKKITILQCSVKNISSKTINIKSENIYLRETASNAPISQLPPSEVADRMKLASWPYWIWGLLWVGTYENNNGNVSNHMYPVGLIIGAINFFRAENTNENFEKDITDHSFPAGNIKPGEVKSGMIFFNRRSAQKYNLVLTYADSLGNNKDLSLQYKL